MPMLGVSGISHHISYRVIVFFLSSLCPIHLSLSLSLSLSFSLSHSLALNLYIYIHIYLYIYLSFVYLSINQFPFFPFPLSFEPFYSFPFSSPLSSSLLSNYTSFSFLHIKSFKPSAYPFIYSIRPLKCAVDAYGLT